MTSRARATWLLVACLLIPVTMDVSSQVDANASPPLPRARALVAAPTPPAKCRKKGRTSHFRCAAFDDSAANLYGGADGSSSENAGTDSDEPRHFQKRSSVPACDGNTVRVPGRDAMCGEAAEECTRRGQPGAYLVWTFVGPLDDPNPDPTEWMSSGSRCVRPEDGHDAQPVPVLTATQFRRLPLPPGTAHVQPAQAPVLVNYPMNVYVDADPVVLRTTVLGADVEVEASPTRFTWTFGDGHTLTTDDPGGPYPAMTTTHTYTRTGHRTITLTTTYTGRYRVEGSPEWLPVAGTATLTSPPIPVQVIETRAVLVP